MIGIEGKVIAITGASSGIGKATALKLAGQGAILVLAARREDRLAALAQAIGAKGATASYRVTDVRRREDVEALVTHAVDTYGKLDVLVSNAGIAPISPLDDLRVDDWEAMIDVNVKSVLYGIAAALPVFRRQGFGHFVNTISTAGLKIVPTMAVYAGSKNAVRTITEGLRQEAGASLRVTGISPGFVDTDLASSMTDPAMRARGEAGMKSMGMPASAVADAIVFAISQPPNVDVGEIVLRPTAQG